MINFNLTGWWTHIAIASKTRVVSFVCLCHPRSHKVFRAFHFVDTCNELSSWVDLKVRTMDQNGVTAVCASVFFSTQCRETNKKNKNCRNEKSKFSREN